MYCVGPQPMEPSRVPFPGAFFSKLAAPISSFGMGALGRTSCCSNNGIVSLCPKPCQLPSYQLGTFFSDARAPDMPYCEREQPLPRSPEFEGEMHPVELRIETLYDLPSQSQTPAFLRRQKREPQRSNEVGSPCCQGAHREQRLAPDGLRRQDVFPLCLPWEQDT